MRIPAGAWKLVKEIARHVLRRPVVGIAAAAQLPSGQWLLIQRTDTGQWALPGGTLEWGEQLSVAIERELMEEAGVQLEELGELVGVFSDPKRDARFHAVTVVVKARVSDPIRKPDNPLEIAAVKGFEASDLPPRLAHGMTDMLRAAVEGRQHLE